jgi:hypothetical protein
MRKHHHYVNLLEASKPGFYERAQPYIPFILTVVTVFTCLIIFMWLTQNPTMPTLRGGI